MNFNKLISELKRRNVFKVATAYAITGWLIIQIVTSISEPLALPKWFDPVIIIIVLIGFPISLLFAWAFEIVNEIHFNRKNVSVHSLQFDLDPLYNGIRNTNKVKEVFKRIREDIDSMKDKAIVYLKSEGLWSKYKEDNEK
jgi:hypothetical protein